MTFRVRHTKGITTTIGATPGGDISVDVHLLKGPKSRCGSAPVDLLGVKLAEA